MTLVAGEVDGHSVYLIYFSQEHSHGTDSEIPGWYAHLARFSIMQVTDAKFVTRELGGIFNLDLSHPTRFPRTYVLDGYT